MSQTDEPPPSSPAAPGGVEAGDGRRNFYGRRHGKTLRPSQKGYLAEDLAALTLAGVGREKNPARAPLDLPATFGARPVWLEIGFGGGEHLVHRAGEEPSTGFIGVEPFVNSMAKLLGSVRDLGLENIRVYDDDATVLLDWLPEASVDRIDLLYPDPWPKRKHWKRRFVSQVNLERFHRVLKPGGLFCFASDIDTYVNWTLQHCRRHGGFAWTARNAADWLTPYAGWPGTRYEAKARREGRSSAYLTFRRI